MGRGPGQTSYVTRSNPSIAHYADRYPHSTLAYGAFGQDFIHKAVRQGRPFCLSISFKAPHRPDTPDPRFDAVYAGKVFSKPENYGREHGRHFSEQSRQGRQYARFTQWKYDREYDAVMARYHQQVYGIDVAVGMIRDALQQHGVAHNTVIIYTSDNGFLCGSHGYASEGSSVRGKLACAADCARSKASRQWPVIRCTALTGNIDFAPYDRWVPQDGAYLLHSCKPAQRARRYHRTPTPNVRPVNPASSKTSSLPRPPNVVSAIATLVQFCHSAPQWNVATPHCPSS